MKLGPGMQGPTVIKACRLFIHKYPPLPIANYSFILPSQLMQCRVSELVKFDSTGHEYGFCEREYNNNQDRH